jgi:hypothetical protein
MYWWLIVVVVMGSFSAADVFVDAELWVSFMHQRRMMMLPCYRRKLRSKAAFASLG